MSKWLCKNASWHWHCMLFFPHVRLSKVPGWCLDDVDWETTQRSDLLRSVLGWYYSSFHSGQFWNQSSLFTNWLSVLGSNVYIFCWQFIIVFKALQHKTMSLRGVPYPEWAEVLGWFIVLFTVIWLPICMVFKSIQLRGVRVCHTYFTPLTC